MVGASMMRLTTAAETLRSSSEESGWSAGPRMMGGTMLLNGECISMYRLIERPQNIGPDASKAGE